MRWGELDEIPHVPYSSLTVGCKTDLNASEAFQNISALNCVRTSSHSDDTYSAYFSYKNYSTISKGNFEINHIIIYLGPTRKNMCLMKKVTNPS